MIYKELDEDSYSSEEESGDYEQERADKVKRLDDDISKLTLNKIIVAMKNNIKNSPFAIGPMQASNQRNPKDKMISDDVSASGKSKASSRRSSRFGGGGDKDSYMLKEYTEMINSVQNGLKKVDGLLKKKVERITKPTIDKSEQGLKEENNKEDEKFEREDSDHDVANPHDLIVEDYLISLKNKQKGSFKNMLSHIVKKLSVDLPKINETLEGLMSVVYTKKAVAKNLPPKLIDIAENLVYWAKESIMLRKMQVVGLKMKIYFERLKSINAIEFLKKVKRLKFDEFKAKEEFVKCIKYWKVVKKEIEDWSDIYRQFHLKMDSTSSSILGYITSMTYHNADLWEAVDLLTTSNFELMKKLNEYDAMVHSIDELYEVFREIQKTDYDVLYK